MNITKEFQMSMVHRDEFTDMRAEFGQLFKQMNDMKVFREKIDQQVTDDHFLLIKTDHGLQEAEATLEKLQIDVANAVKGVQHKLDADVFDEEIEQIRSIARTASQMTAQVSYATSQAASQAQAAGQGQAKPMPQPIAAPKAGAGRGGGMTKAERVKLRETAEAVERMEAV